MTNKQEFAGTRASMLARVDKYREQCTKTGQKIEQKLNAYAENPGACIARSHNTKYHIKPGTQLVKKHRGTDHIVTIAASDKFIYKNTSYSTLSDVVLIICGHKVSGYEFFGFRDRNKA
jgi:hypothetical protein